MLGDGLKKPLLITYILIFFILLIQVFTSTVISDAELPEWSVGDKWKYETSIVGIMGNITTEVIEMSTINVNGTNYEVYIVETILELTIEEMIITHTINNYILRSDLSTVKTELTETFEDGSSLTAVTTYTPPRKDYDFPLAVGKEWTSNFAESTYVEDTGYYNFTKLINYTVVGQESVTVGAGTFDSYKIEIDDGLGNVIYSWYSPEVNNVVNTTGRPEEMGLPMKLTRYQYNDEDDGETNPSLVPYLLLLLLIPIIVILFVGLFILRKGRKKKKRKKKRKKKKKKK